VASRLLLLHAHDADKVMVCDTCYHQDLTSVRLNSASTSLSMVPLKASTVLRVKGLLSPSVVALLLWVVEPELAVA
jgi:hypothetical protein